MIRNGLTKIAPHRKDYSLLHTFGDVLPDPKGLPIQFSIYDGREIPNQNTFDDRFVPALRPLLMGCTAETTTFIAGLEDGALYDPVDFYFATPPGTDGEGRDIRDALDTASTRGFMLSDRTIGAKRAPYFNCYGAGPIDDFQAVQIALWLNQDRKVGVSIGSWWYPEFSQPVSDRVPTPSFDMSRATLHNWLVTGWVGDELECIPWIGQQYANDGRVYMSRAIFNALMAQPWTGAFTQRPLDGHTPVSVGFQAYIDHFIYWFRHTFKV